MSTTYRVYVHCDETRGADCVGVFEFRTRDLHRLPQHADVEALGWLRGYREAGTWDVCPACRPAVEREMKRAKPATLKEATS